MILRLCRYTSTHKRSGRNQHMSLFNELKRRNVFRVAIAYVVMSWLVMQVADVILNNIEVPGWIFQVILLLLGIGFLIAMRLFTGWKRNLNSVDI